MSNKTIKNMSDKELIEEANYLYSSIYIVDSYSVSDISNYMLICMELERRGYKINEQKELVIMKNKRMILQK